MGVDLLQKEHIEFGKRVEVIALCSKVEVKQNLSSVGSYREIYSLNGKEGTFISGIIFKVSGSSQVDVDKFTDEPVLVVGTIGEYRDALQIHIESITPIGLKLDKNDLLAEMVDTKLLDELNDTVWNLGSSYTHTFNHLRPALGLVDVGAGTYIERLYRFILMANISYPDLVKEYIQNISLLTSFYTECEGTLSERVNMCTISKSTLLMNVLFNDTTTPEHEDFVKLHNLIMKPRGYALEILDCSRSTNNTDYGDSN